MFRQFIRFGAAAAIGLILTVSMLARAAPAFAEQPNSPMPADKILEVFGRLPMISNLTLSPDGSKIAQVANLPEGLFLVITETATHKGLNRVPLPASKIRGLLWADNQKLIVMHSSTSVVWGLENGREEWALGYMIDFATGKATRFLDKVETSVERLEPMNTLARPPVVVTGPKGEPQVILTGLIFPESRSHLALFRQNAVRATLFVSGSEDTAGWALSPMGEVIGRVEYERRSGSWSIYAGAGKGQLSLMKSGINPFGHPVLAGVSSDGGSIYVTDVEEDTDPLYRIDVKDRTWAPAGEAYAGGYLITEPATNIAIGYVVNGKDQPIYTFFDPTDQTIWQRVLKAFKGAHVEFESMSADRTKILVSVFGGEWGNSYLLIDRKSMKADYYADVYDGIGPDELSKRTLIHYKAADGFDIPAYLTLPKSKPAKGLPLIVLPHGGPFARDMPGFDWWSQAYASRGYAVLQPQFRGSAGFGTAHLEAGYGEYGRKMQTDLSDGVADLARQGIIDPKRVAIVGASYGGYAALAGVAFQKDIYRCAVSLAGPSDMTRQLAYFREKSLGDSRNPATRYWRNFLQVKSDYDPRLDEISPALHPEGITVPVMLIHGKDDTVVQIDQSRRMEKALRALNKPVELVEMKGEDHWHSNSDTGFEMLSRSVKFLETCNPPN